METSRHLRGVCGRVRWKDLAFTIVTVPATLLVIGVALECVLRLGLIENSLYLRYNSRETVENARHKLLIVGDSFMRPTKTLGRRLGEELISYGVAVRNASVSGTGPFEYLDEVKANAATFRPSIVLLGYYAGNDLTNVQHHPRFRQDGERNGDTGLAINFNSSPRFFRNVYAYHFLLRRAQRMWSLFFDYDALAESGASEELVEAARRREINPWLLRLAAAQPHHLLDNILMETDENMRAWSKVGELIEEIQEVCQEMGAHLVVVVFPRSIQVNRALFGFHRDLGFDLDERTLELSKPQALFMDLCNELHLECLDLLPIFRTRRKDDFYLPRDDHLNEAGNNLTADLILEFLIDNDVI